MSTLQQNEAAARRCVELFNQKRIAEWVTACYAENVEWIELPRPSTPNGQHGDREAYRAAAERALEFVPDRQMETLNLVAQADQVALELDWRGTTVTTLGGSPDGLGDPLSNGHIPHFRRWDDCQGGRLLHPNPE